MLYNSQEYKLVKLDPATTEEIFGPTGGESRFLNVAALYSVTTFAHAEETCRILRHLNPQARTVMDATVCVGGNTGSLCNNFEKVVGVELDPKNLSLARANLSGKTNLTLVQGSCLEYLIEESSRNPSQDSPWFDAIVFDPPWNIDHVETIDHSTVGIPGVSLRDSVSVFLNFTDYLILKTSRNDNVEFYKEYLVGTRFDVLEIDLSNYKLMLFAPKGDKGLDFSNYVTPTLRSFNYKKILKKIEPLMSE